MTRAVESLSPKEILALAVHVERANARRFRAFVDIFTGFDPAVAGRFEELAQEEDEHEDLLVKRFRKVFGDEEIPVVEEVEVEGVIESVDLDGGEHMIFDSLKPAEVYKLAHRAETGAQEFYRRAAELTGDAESAQLFRSLAEMEDEHAGWLEAKMREGEGGAS